MLEGDVFAERVFKLLDLYEAKEIDRVQFLIKITEMFAVHMNRLKK